MNLIDLSDFLFKKLKNRVFFTLRLIKSSFKPMFSLHKFESIFCSGNPKLFQFSSIFWSLFNKDSIMSFQTSKITLKIYLQSWATSILLERTAKSLVFVLVAESVPFNFLRQTNSRNFLANITELISSPVLNGMTRAPLLKRSFASLTVRSSYDLISGRFNSVKLTPLKGWSGCLSSSSGKNLFSMHHSLLRNLVK